MGDGRPSAEIERTRQASVRYDGLNTDRHGSAQQEDYMAKAKKKKGKKAKKAKKLVAAKKKVAKKAAKKSAKKAAKKKK